MLEKVYRIIAHYPEGGTECFGNMETEEAAEKRIERLFNHFKENDTGSVPCEYEIRVVFKAS